MSNLICGVTLRHRASRNVRMIGQAAEDGRPHVPINSGNESAQSPSDLTILYNTVRYILLQRGTLYLIYIRYCKVFSLALNHRPPPGEPVSRTLTSHSQFVC